MPKFPSGDDVYVGGVKLENTTVVSAAIAAAVAAATTGKVPAPVAADIELDATKKIVTIPYDFAIFRNGTVAEAKALVEIATDGTTFAALGASDTVTIDSMNLVVTFDSALTLATNKLKIKAGVVKSAYGVLNALYTTAAIDAS